MKRKLSHMQWLDLHNAHIKISPNTHYTCPIQYSLPLISQPSHHSAFKSTKVCQNASTSKLVFPFVEFVKYQQLLTHLECSLYHIASQLTALFSGCGV